jgi:SOS-response transcriptional repressor LexA
MRALPPHLPPRQYELMNYLWSCKDARRGVPTVREIAAALGVKSLATVHKQLVAVLEKGYVKRRCPRAKLVLQHRTRGPMRRTDP